MSIENLAANLVDSGEWLSFEIYLAWVKEQERPQEMSVFEASGDVEAPTVRPLKAA